MTDPDPDPDVALARSLAEHVIERQVHVLELSHAEPILPAG